ncbi:MAG: tRNA 2-thiocytidine biosynthesis TtcA family protein [Ruminococcus sp.]|nr:tRNA 2-thiocytidine biosynthesis TtcA family protein [Ruminococcus sp.]
MQKILGHMRKAIQQYDMIRNGDRIAVGVSGGKDSVALLVGLARLRSFIGISYEVTALTIDPAFGGVATDYSPISELCRGLGVEHVVVPTQIGEIVFDARREPNPCSLCSRMRRGALTNAAAELGCGKIALGHNYDDTVETFIMNLFNEGRIGCYSPVTTFDDRDIAIIRPLVLTEEREIRRAVKRNGLPVVKSACPADGHTNRERTKQLIAQLERTDRGLKDRLFGALVRGDIDGWGIK